MKRFLQTLIIAAVALLGTGTAWAQKGDQTFGIETGYTSHNRSALLGVFYHYDILESLRIAPDMGFVFRHNDQESFFLDLNLHVPLRLQRQPIQLYPLAGLNYTSWGLHSSISEIAHRHRSKWGCNVGAGFQLRASECLMLKIEAKYTLTSKFSTFVLDCGLGYVF